MRDVQTDSAQIYAVRYICKKVRSKKKKAQEKKDNYLTKGEYTGCRNVSWEDFFKGKDL